MRTLAIDPGPVQSAYCLIDADCTPNVFGKVNNRELVKLIRYDGWRPELVALEMVASYGMSVGADVFETCVWIGRFIEVIAREWDVEPALVKRHPIKLHLCHSAKANDANISQALVDRFAYGQPNHGKGTKAAPGFFFGFAKDIWQAYALAVYAADTGAA